MSQAYGKQFSRIYNLRWGNFARQIAPQILKYYESTPLGKSNKAVLDLCCGAGHLSAIFLEHGYSVVGIDLSTEMLEYARQNAGDYLVQGKARFMQADAANFTIDQSVPFVVSMYDSLNHLPDLTSLRNCFASVYRVALPGGIFIFDLNTRTGLRRRWNSISVEDDEELTLINRSFYDEENSRGWTRISGFIRNQGGNYERFEETVYNTAFELLAVRNALIETGWANVMMVSGNDFYTPLDEPENEPRVFFIARK
ncbi:MAG: class I SAM-dependent methyltransferase [Anaerolineales bacterium]|nr:class I SAM-dependent methyltransferase [Anaerolineales bacterium]